MYWESPKVKPARVKQRTNQYTAAKEIAPSPRFKKLNHVGISSFLRANAVDYSILYIKSGISYILAAPVYLRNDGRENGKVQAQNRRPNRIWNHNELRLISDLGLALWKSEAKSVFTYRSRSQQRSYDHNNCPKQATHWLWTISTSLQALVTYKEKRSNREYKKCMYIHPLICGNID